MKDVYNPDYYRTGNIEVADFIEDKGFDFFLGNVVKYVSRAGKKEGNSAVQDLKKAQWYLSREIEILSGNRCYEPKDKHSFDKCDSLKDIHVPESAMSTDKHKCCKKKKNTTQIISDDDYADIVATISMCMGCDDDDDFPYDSNDFSWGDSWDDGDGEIWSTILTKYEPKNTGRIKRKPRKNND